MLTTNSVLELFYDTNISDVIFTDLSIKHKDYNSWDVKVTLTNSGYKELVFSEGEPLTSESELVIE